MHIDFRKTINDGSLLTHPKNSALLKNIKRFLCLQTHPALTGSITVNLTSARMLVSIALHVVDYFLLKSAEINLAKKGFSLVTADDVMLFVDVLTSNRSIKSSIYAPMERIKSLLDSVDVSAEDLTKAYKNWPDLFELSDTHSDGSIHCKEKILKIRVWLKLNDVYSPGNYSGLNEFKYRVNRTRLLSLAIGDRVLSKLKFDGLNLADLDVAPSRRFHQELLAVPVNNLDEDERASDEYVGCYIAALNSMRVARQHGVDLISERALTVLDESAILRNEKTKERARFTTLPFEVANSLFGHAIEFYLEYGTELVDYYLALAAIRLDIRELSIPVPEKLQALGITNWRTSAKTPAEFFAELRDGQNLYNMLEVLYGAIAIIVNTLMARRASELESLTRESVVEDNGWYFLAFDLRKANIMEHRERSIRPLPYIGAEALRLLGKMSDKLEAMGYKSSKYLFGFPFSAWHSNPPFYGLCQPDLRRCFDRFCDFYQAPTDEKGRRYYIRAHQLRRNFAMLFFWQGSFGGIEVLRHFLGHKKPSFTYRYVTEAIPGRALRRVKATVAKDMIKVDHSATEALAELICQRYGLTLDDLHILPERDVVDYVEDLLASGEAEVEPEFFEGQHGEEYRILYKVIKNPNIGM
ncbi:hypothetical protein [Massilia sp. UBA6681]|uniref:hypothetical protein n=1 Tax=Massilia sp. UBA6681 TaxID=1946839 RepID=UPI0025C15A7A|nr:hypothetical protein [Massilia sp. UBA6681]